MDRQCYVKIVANMNRSCYRATLEYSVPESTMVLVSLSSDDDVEVPNAQSWPSWPSWQS